MSVQVVLIFLKSHAALMPWFRGEGKQDKGAYDPTREAPTPLPSASNEGVRFRIADVFVITGTGIVLVGEVEAGRLHVGQELTLQPGLGSKTISRTVTVHSIMANHQNISEAGIGTKVGTNVRGIEKHDARRGDYLSR